MFRFSVELWLVCGWYNMISCTRFVGFRLDGFPELCDCGGFGCLVCRLFLVEFGGELGASVVLVWWL